MRNLPAGGVNAPIEIYRGALAEDEAPKRGGTSAFALCKTFEGLALFAAALDLPRAFSAQATGTLQLDTLHLRHQGPLDAGGRMRVHAGVLDIEDHAATVRAELDLEGHGPAAALRLRLIHAPARGGGAPFAWPARARARLEALRLTPDPASPAFALAPDFTPAPDVNSEAATRLGLALVGRGAFTAEECCVFARVRPDALLARMAHAELPARDAALEQRLAIRLWPRAGDLYEVRAGRAVVEGGLLRVVHWMLDPQSGRAWASADAVFPAPSSPAETDPTPTPGLLV